MITGLRQRAADDRGFTLIELLITIVIMGVITLPLANFVLEYFTHTSTAKSRVSESHDEQLAATYFSDDVANVGTRDQLTMNFAQSVWPGSFPLSSCGGASAANQVLLLKWDNVTWDGTSEAVRVDSVAYIKVTSSGETQLRRVYCQASTQISSTIVVHNLDPATAPVVTCSSTCTGSPAIPATINLQLRITNPAGDGQPFTITLTGQRRQST